MTYATMENAQKILGIMQHAAETLMLPRFGKLLAEHIQSKSDKSIVTEVDMAVEKFMSTELLREFPGTTIIGEESYAADQTVLRQLNGVQPVWVLDPLDGTSAFAHGEPGWGILLSYVENGQVTMTVVLDPIAQEYIIALRGQGVFLNGTKIESSTTPKPLAELNGLAWLEFLAPDIAPTIEKNIGNFGHVTDECNSCVGVSFCIARDQVDFFPFAYSNPWDLLPLVLIVDELGGHSGKLDGRPLSGESLSVIYEGSLFVRHAAQWQQVRDAFFHAIDEQRLCRDIHLSHK